MPHAHDTVVGERLIGALLRLPAAAVQDHTARRLGAEFPGLRPAQMVVFQHVDHPPAGSRLTELAAAAQMTKQSMQELVDALEREGFVERTPDPTDRRAKLIRLTARGWAVHERTAEIVRALQEEWAAALGPDKMAHLLALLRELHAALRLDSGHAHAGPAAPSVTPPSDGTHSRSAPTSH